MAIGKGKFVPPPWMRPDDDTEGEGHFPFDLSDARLNSDARILGRKPPGSSPDNYPGGSMRDYMVSVKKRRDHGLPPLWANFPGSGGNGKKRKKGY